MADQFFKQFLHNLGYNKNLLRQQESCIRFVYGVLSRCLSQCSRIDRVETDVLKETNDASQVPVRPKLVSKMDYDSLFRIISSDDSDPSCKNWMLELAWIRKSLELQLCSKQLDLRRTLASRLNKLSSDVNDLREKMWRLELAWLTESFEPALQLCSKQSRFRKALASRLSKYSYDDSDVIARLWSRQSDFRKTLASGLCNDNDLSGKKWTLEVAWLMKSLGPALQLCKWALPAGSGAGNGSPPKSRSVSEILGSIQRSKIGIEDWSLSNFTIGLYLLYLRQASTNPFEDVKGHQILSDSIVQDLIYHTELARGAYKNGAASLAKSSMLRESNIVKYVKSSSVMQPAYYIGIDTHKKLVVLGIRGTHNIYDLITDILTSSDGEVMFDGYSTHFGAAEAARWFLSHEMETIKNCLDKHKGFRLRLVGHSLGGATASLLALMLRKKSSKNLGFRPDIVSAIGFATPPCVPRELAEKCADFVTTVVMQDDIVPRICATSLMRLRYEILQTDWMSVLDEEDRKSLLGLATNAKQVVSSVQDIVQKLADSANFGSKTTSDVSTRKELLPSTLAAPTTFNPAVTAIVDEEGDECIMPEELFIPGSVYYLKKNNKDIDNEGNKENKNTEGTESFTLWKRHPGEHFERIVLSSNLFSDHKCDSHYYALRDVLKGLPRSSDEFIFG